MTRAQEVEQLGAVDGAGGGDARAHGDSGGVRACWVRAPAHTLDSNIVARPPQRGSLSEGSSSMSEWNDKVIEELRANGGTAEACGTHPAHPAHHGREERPGAPVAAALPRAGRRPRDLRLVRGRTGQPGLVPQPGGPPRRHRRDRRRDPCAPGPGRPSRGARRALRLEQAGLRDFKEYETKTDRRIPVVILEPGPIGHR